MIHGDYIPQDALPPGESVAQNADLDGTMGAHKVDADPQVEEEGCLARIKARLAGFSFRNLASSAYLHCKAEILHLQHDMSGKEYRLFVASQFGEDCVATTKNIARKEVLASAEDQYAADELGNACNGLLAQPAFAGIQMNQNPSNDMSDGICNGICLDIAQRYLSGSSVEQIIQEDTKGASAEASANQSVYQRLSTTNSPAAIMREVGDKMMELATHKDFDGGPVSPKAVTVFRQKMRDGSTVEQLKELLQINANGKPIDPQLLRSLRLAVSLEEFKEAMEILSKRKSEKKATLEQITALVTDPVHREYAKQIMERYLSDADKVTGIIAAARGMQMESVLPVMGHHVFYENDTEYLSNLSRLDPGFYSISFRTGKGSHTISYIKEGVHPNERGYILDPNGFRIQCSNSTDASEKLRKLMNFYPRPSFQSPNEPDVPDHQIKMWRIKREL